MLIFGVTRPLKFVNDHVEIPQYIFYTAPCSTTDDTEENPDALQIQCIKKKG